jgi:hypothetical protein
MPICINLLAEAKAAEELRRKDPVKRATFIGGFIVFLFVLWSMSLQFKIMASKSELSTLDARWKDIEKTYQGALDTRKRATDVETKLSAVQQMTTNRFLWGTAFNAVQQTLVGVDNVQVMRLKTEQVYAHAEEVKPRKDGTRFVPGRPATATEKISITLDAVDSSGQPGGQVSRFKEAIALVPFFQNALQKTNGVLLTSLSAPQSGASGRAQVNFTLQCFFPEKVR